MLQRFKGVKYRLERDQLGAPSLENAGATSTMPSVDILIFVVSARDRGRLKESANEFRCCAMKQHAVNQRIAILNSFAVRDSDLARDKPEEVHEHFGEEMAVIDEPAQAGAWDAHSLSMDFRATPGKSLGQVGDRFVLFVAKRIELEI